MKLLGITPRCVCGLLCACLWLALLPWAHAGGGPTGYIVVYNPSDPRSVTIANRYQQVRGIPERNMFPYVFPTSFSRTTAWDFVYWLRQTITARGLDGQFQGIALAGITPLDAAQHVSGSYVFSIQSFLYLSPNFSQANFPTAANGYQNAYTPLTNFLGAAPAGTVALTPAMSFSGKSYWPVSAVGFPGKSGNSTLEILNLIDRSRTHDGAKPDGTIYWPLNSDIRSTTRESEIGDVDNIWTARGLNYVVTGSSTNSNPWTYDRSDVVGGIVGIANFSVNGNMFLPGAWVDHLTSYGGMLDSFSPGGQTTVAAWLRAGVDGSSGTMGEPYAIAAKFTHAHIHTHFRSGASLAEAFWQSLRQPAEIVCVGDPLLQPYADFPSVAVTSPADGTTVNGTITITATATPTGGKLLATNLDLFVDGLLVADSSTGEFALDTTTLADGWHELRIVAYNADAVRTQGEGKFSLMVNNTGQSIMLTGPATINPDTSASFTLTPTGLIDLRSLALQSNGRTLATVATGGGTATLMFTNTASLAPLTNDWVLLAVGTRSNGQQVWSTPFTTTPLWPAQGATPNPVLGAAMADVRYFASTTNSSFSWDTATPDLVTNHMGDASTGLSLIASNGIFGLTFNYATKPGFQLDCWLYAPADDWYELGYEFGNGTYAQNRACFLDGQLLTERNYVFGPRRLAAGWHVLRMRFALNNAAWVAWKAKLRGGASQDFVILNRANVANYGTGVEGGIPVILALTPSAAPVTTTTVKLNASATIGGGGSNELAGLTYYWSLLSGPKSVTFSTNAASAVTNTTVTFSAAGNYVFGLRVADASNSAVTNLAVTVNQTASGLSLSAGLRNTALDGLPFDLFVFSKDQFGRRMEITPTTNGMPTVQWSVSDSTGTFTLHNASGEEAAYRSLLATVGNTNVSITATGINGRTGSASTTLTVSTNAPPAMIGTHLFTISQSAAGQAVSMMASVSDTETSAGYWRAPLLAYQWSVVSTPSGQTLTLATNLETQATALFSGPGTYVVRLDVTDQAGAAISETQSFTVDETGTAFYLPILTGPYNASAYAGSNATFNVSCAKPVTCLWQMSTNAGADWIDFASFTNNSLSYGPVSGVDNSNLFRVICSNLGGTSTSSVARLTVTDPVGGSISITGIWSQTVAENVGMASVVVRRSGQSTGAVSVDWGIYDGDALLGEDYLGVDGASQMSGTLTWADGDLSDRIVSVPIVNDSILEDDEYFYLYLSNAQGGATLRSPYYQYIYITDDDGSGQASFTAATATISKGNASLSLTVRRSVSSSGTLSVDYATSSGTAVSGQHFVQTSGNLTWGDGDSADKTIVVPILNDGLVESNKQFTVALNSTNSVTLGAYPSINVTVTDSPYQQWQRTWWPSAVPAVPTYGGYATGAESLKPLFLFRFSEAAGATAYGVDASGSNVVITGALTNSGGSYALGAIGPRPPAWPGLEDTNTALAFTAMGSTGAPPQFSAGASANCGTANGLGTNLAKGFTFTAFINTAITNRQMFIAGGARVGATNTAFSITLNRAFNNSTSYVPHTLRIYLRPEAVSGKALEYSVAFSNLATGSLCDGQWHHIAIAQPMFSNVDNTDYPHLYFDGVEANLLNVRGTENVASTNSYANFSDIGFRLGADGSSNPATFFNGSMDEVAFFPSVLSVTTITNLAAARPPTPMPDYTQPAGDADADGYSNFDEFTFGSTPTSSGSVPAALAVTPAAYDFGTVSIGASAAQATFTVTNAGSSSLTGTASTVGSSFAIVSGGLFTVAAGSTSAVVVSFAPLTAGPFSGKLICASNGGGATNDLGGAGVYPAPLASFSATPTNGVGPLLVTFTDTSTGMITNRFWDFGDGGSTNLTATNLTHIYSFAGTNMVTLIASGPSGVSTNIQTDCIMVLTRITGAANPAHGGAVAGGGVYPWGSNVLLTATASNGWLFTQWNDGATNSARAVAVPQTNITYTANFAPAATIAVGVNTNVGGNVTGSGVFFVGSNNVLNATASNGWQFLRWNDGSTGNPRTIVVVSNATYTAVFAPTVVLAVQANPVNSGSVTGGGTYVVGSNALLTATASNLWQFMSWNDGSTNALRTVVVPEGGATYTAIFAQMGTVSVIANPTNGGGVAGGGLYLLGSNATVTAAASNTWLFLNWNGAVTNNPWTFQVASNGIACTATFARISTVTVQANPASAGSVSGGGIYLVGSNVTLVAMASNSWLFTQWNDGVTSGSRPATVPLTNITYTANFAPAVTITVAANTNAGGYVTGGGIFFVGSNQVLTATASNGWQFIRWNDGATNNPRSMVVASNTSYMAIFAPTAVLTVLASPVNGGSVTGGGTYVVGSNALLMATASNLWQFMSWNDGSTNASRTVVVPEGGETYTATFVPLGFVTVWANPTNAGSATGAGWHVIGSNAAVAATASNGWLFANWNGTVTNNPWTFVLTDSAMICTANFSRPVAVTLAASPAYAGSVSGGGVHPAGRSVMLSAVPAPGWLFVRWSDGHTNASRIITVPAASISYTATFTMGLGVALNASNLIWATGGNAGWNVQTATTPDGAAARSGAISVGQQTWMQTTTNGPLSLLFWWKVSSAPNNYLQFYINTQLVSQISGNVDWNQYITFLGTTNQYTLKWVYTKTSATISGSDAGWVDQITALTCPYATHAPQLFFQEPGGMIASWVVETNGAFRFARILASTGAWALKSAGDIDGDGVSDLLFQNTASDTGGWFLNADGSVRDARFWFNIGGWEIKACADYDGTGRGQVFFQNASGVVAYWRLDTTGAFQSAVVLGNMAGWTLRGAGDLDGDHKAELFWQNAAGVVSIWYHNPDGSIRSTIAFTTGEWALSGVADVDADGVGDLLWQTPDTRTGGWFMQTNGLARDARFWWPTGGWKLKAAGR